MNNTISVMLDCSRNAVPNVKFLKQFIDNLAKCGYNQLQLYMEDTYKIDGEKYFGYFRGAYTKEELQEIDDYGFSKGIEVIPAIQVLGHLNSIFYWGEYFDVRDCGDCLLADEPKTYELIEKMIKQMSETFRSKKINIGMDESFNSGKGKYLEKFGYKKADDIYFSHLTKVAEILKKYDREAMMWGDMFYRNMNNGAYYSSVPVVSENAKKLIPSNVDIIYWDYYNVDRETMFAMAKSAIELKKGAYFAGGAWNWIGFEPATSFAIHQSKEALKIVKDAGITNFILTLWGDNGAECSKLATLPTLYCFAQFANGNTDEKVIKESFKKEFGIEMDTLISLEKLNRSTSERSGLYNTCKFMLFNDILAGIYDFVATDEKATYYGDLVEQYNKYTNDLTFGYIFKSAAALANALNKKLTIGKRLREAYLANDKNKLKVISNDLLVIKDSLKVFYENFKNQWYKENKLTGFEVQTLRLGGLMLRCDEAIELINDFINGKIDSIYTLEQDVKIFEGCKEGDDLLNNWYSICASVNVQ